MRKRKLKNMVDMAKRTDFSLPPNITFDKALREDGLWTYIFTHKDLGDLGHITFMPHSNGTQCVYTVLGEPDDPMTAKRYDAFAPVAMDISGKMEMICGKASEKALPIHLKPEAQIIESKIMPCSKCGVTTSMMVFAPEANTLGQLENYARLMFTKIKEENVPTWIVGSEKEVLINGEFAGEALVLKVWPQKEPARVINSIELNSLFDYFMDNHCKT